MAFFLSGFAEEMFIWGDRIITCETFGTNTFFTVFDKANGELLQRFCNKGRAKNEITDLSNAYIDETNNLFVVCSVNDRKYLRYKLPTQPQDSIEFLDSKTIKRNLNYMKTFNVNGEVYVSGDWAGDKAIRFGKIVNDTAQLLYKGFPKLVDDDIENCRVWGDRGFTKPSPDGRHIVSTTFYGTHFQIFDITKKGEIEPKCLYAISPPAYRVVGQYPSISLTQLDETIFGFVQVFTTDDYIFAILVNDVGEKVQEALDKITVFDWDGNLDFIIKLDRPIFNFCVDSQSRTIYAITIPNEKGEQALVKYKYTIN